MRQGETRQSQSLPPQSPPPPLQERSLHLRLDARNLRGRRLALSPIIHL